MTAHIKTTALFRRLFHAVRGWAEFKKHFSETTNPVFICSGVAFRGKSQKSPISNCLKLEETFQKGGNMSQNEEVWMSLGDVASEAQLPLSTIYYLHKRGKGPKTAQIGRHLRVLRQDFIDWFEDNRTS
jgi:predicted DNA-binding transcriptional regulator AlpA